jgi:hypothetical protein
MTSWATASRRRTNVNSASGLFPIRSRVAPHDGAHGIEEQFVEVEVGSVNARTSDHDGRSGNVPSWRECKEMWSPPDQADAVRESRTGTTRTCLLAFRLNHRHSSPVLRFHKPYWRR